MRLSIVPKIASRTDVSSASANFLFLLAAPGRRVDFLQGADKAVPYDLSSGQSVPLFFEVGEDEKALEIVDKISKRSLAVLLNVLTTLRWAETRAF